MLTRFDRRSITTLALLYDLANWHSKLNGQQTAERMIQRRIATCNSCDNQFIFRGVVPQGKNSRFLFACPSCGIRLSGAFEVDSSIPQAEIVPSGFLFTSIANSKDLATVTVSTDLPVHKTRHEENLVKGGSPFLWLSMHMGPGFLEWKQTVDGLHEFKDNYGATLQELVNYASIEQWDKIRDILAEKIDPNLEQANDENVIYVVHRLLCSFYVTLVPFSEMVTMLDEYYSYLNDCFDNHGAQYAQLLNDFQSKYGFGMFKKQVYGTYLRIIDAFDSFVTGLLYEKMSDEMRAELTEYRLYRTDYDVIKSLYQDLFELNSKSMLYIGAIVNLSKRNDPCSFASGKNSCNSFRKLTSFQKLAVLEELPFLKEFVGKVSRPMRNKIGHFSAEYDYSSGNIIFEDGSTQNYIEFLAGFLWAVRSIWFLLTVIEKAELDNRKLRIRA